MPASDLKWVGHRKEQRQQEAARDGDGVTPGGLCTGERDARRPVLYKMWKGGTTHMLN